jgi:transposase
MTKAYSLDLRERVVEHVKRHGNKLAASKLYRLHRGTIDQWLEYDREYKSLVPRKAPGRRSRVDALKLKEYINRHPDHYLREIAQEFGVSYVAIHNALKRLGISRKKNDAVLRARRASEVAVRTGDNKHSS